MTRMMTNEMQGAEPIIAVDSVVKVHVVSDDTRVAAEPDSAANCLSVAAVIGTPALLLPHAPRRIRATLCVNGNAGDTAIIGRQADVGNPTGTPVGCTVSPGQVLPITATSELWLVGKSGASIVVGVIAEYQESS